MDIIESKKLKDFPKERVKIHELAKDMIRLSMQSDYRLYFSIIDLRVIRNQINHVIEILEQGDRDACKDNKQV